MRLRQVRGRHRVHRLDVVGVGVEGLDGRDAQFRRLTRDFLHHADDDRFPGGHRVVRVLGKEEQLLDAVGRDLADHRGDRRLPVAHAEVHGQTVADLFSQFLPHAARDHQQRRPVLGPYLFVGVGGLLGPERYNDAIDQQAAKGRPRFVDDAFVPEKFAQVTFDVGYGSGIGRAQVDEKDGAFRHRANVVGVAGSCQRGAKIRRRPVFTPAGRSAGSARSGGGRSPARSDR